ncbi:glyoxalase [Paenibacillus lycopersici]|uniref:Glyoxalase n=1 Tax=Paenibacillus lycopersici TaxID=2704462 RepID=A0A6C0FPX0_9BACL|nr:VOC family protein [Paenibacillus lycopersici]QHT59178.1 glyoxalase [Paenibacillus lycopersici]
MLFSFTGIDHVQLAAPEGCETAARSFFSGALGWPELPKPEPLRQRGGVWFQCGVQQVHIGVQRDFVPATKAHPAFTVRHIEALAKHLTDAGYPVTLDDARDDEGVRRFFVNDPFGNRLEFMETNSSAAD